MEEKNINVIKKSRLFFTAVAWILIVGNLAAGSNNFEFLLFTPYARSSAMGNSSLALSGDAGLAFGNPASAYGAEENYLSVNYVNFLLDINAYYLTYTLPGKVKLFNHEGFAVVHVLDIDYGEINEVDEYAYETGATKSANDFAMMFTWASSPKENWEYGISAKMAYEKIAEYSSSGLFFDLGAVYYFPQAYKLSAAVSVRNIGFYMSNFTETNQTVPLSIDLGIAKTLRYLPLTLAFQLSRINDGNDSKYIGITDRMSLGFEFAVHPAVTVRGGLNRAIQQSLKNSERAGFTGASVGLGINYKNVLLNISYWNWGDAGNPIQFGMNYGF